MKYIGLGIGTVGVWGGAAVMSYFTLPGDVRAVSAAAFAATLAMWVCACLGKKIFKWINSQTPEF